MQKKRRNQEEGRRNKPKRGRKPKRRRKTVVRCRVTSGVNNTKVVRTGYEKETGRRVNRVRTAGKRGYVNTKRGSRYAAQEVRAQAGKVYQERWGKDGKKVGLHVRRRGMGKGRIQALSEFKKAGRVIQTVSDATKDPHNGCRRKKRRRL